MIYTKGIFRLYYNRCNLLRGFAVENVWGKYLGIRLKALSQFNEIVITVEGEMFKMKFLQSFYALWIKFAVIKFNIDRSVWLLYKNKLTFPSTFTLNHSTIINCYEVIPEKGSPFNHRSFCKESTSWKNRPRYCLKKLTESKLFFKADAIFDVW